MVVATKRYTVEEFDQMVPLPENADRRLEYVGGEVVEVVSNNYASMIAALILAQIVVHVQRHELGYVTGADGGYQVSGERYIPDAAFISKARQPDPSHDAYNPNAPDLAVEVLSPSDDLNLLRVKVANYLAAGTVVWVVRPEPQNIEVYVPGQPVQRLGSDATLGGGEVLPGFEVAVSAVFPE
ncbi:MAG: Uma2 family endonuclease [Anaerolineae bacterium]|nr:Uma2 family endonuclease [Anaerolineae bacterium]